MDKNNIEYYKFAESELPIFFQPWWLDIVCSNGKWNVCLVFNKNAEVVGVLPYYLSRLGFIFKIIRTPPFTPYLGVWLDYSSCSERLRNRYSFENDVITILIEQLPKVTSYHQIHPYELNNWLPFYWKSYSQTTRYTYVLNELSENIVWSSMKDKLRNTIKKAENSGVKVIESSQLELLLNVCRNTFRRQGLRSPFDSKIITALHNELQIRKQGKIFLAQDDVGEVHAGMYLIWDNDTAYCWMLGADTALRKSGAVQLLIWHSIKEAAKSVKTYNFEGSMLPHIEPVFRAFGAERKPVFQIRKFGNRFIEALWILLRKK